MAAQAGPAGGGGYHRAGLYKDIEQALVHTLEPDILGGGDDDAPHTLGHLAALEDLRGRPHILHPAVGAGADDRLVDLHLTVAFIDGVGVFRQMGEGHGGTQGGQIDGDDLLVFRVLVGRIDHRFPLEAALYIGHGDLVHREDAVFGPRLDGHVGDAEPVVDREGSHALPGEFQGFVERAVHADHADEVEDHILAAHIAGGLAGEDDFQGGGHLEPGGAGGHARGQVGGTHAGGEGAQRAIGAGMAVRADDAVAGADQSLFRKDGVFHAHPAHVEEILHIVLAGEFPHPLDLFRRFDVLVGGEVIHHQRHPALVENTAGAATLKFIDRHRRGDVVAQAEIQLGLDQLPGRHLRQTRVGCQDLLCHCHSHVYSSSLSLISLYSMESLRAIQLASITSLETPTVVHSLTPSVDVMRTRTLAAVACRESMTRTL